MYGGTISAACTTSSSSGLSPRVRGNLLQPALSLLQSRSIPACTGEPRIASQRQGQTGVYPRVYGGTWSPDPSLPTKPGLSPRVRGNHETEAGFQQAIRSIPACTGEPGLCPAPRGRPGVYPRVYGGTLALSSLSPPTAPSGLSPRVRGNPGNKFESALTSRSIPACTGEPHTQKPQQRPCTVYPRVYGGTIMPPFRARSAIGLSPRVRGNLELISL